MDKQSQLVTLKESFKALHDAIDKMTDEELAISLIRAGLLHQYETQIEELENQVRFLTGQRAGREYELVKTEALESLSGRLDFVEEELVVHRQFDELIKKQLALFDCKGSREKCSVPVDPEEWETCENYWVCKIMWQKQEQNNAKNI